MPGLLATKWITAKTAAKEHLGLVNWNQGFEALLEKLEDKIDDASENPKPTDKDVNDMKQAHNAYLTAGKDYLKKIGEANTKHPHAGKSWLIFHEAIYKIDQLVNDMLRKDSNMKIQWPKLSGFLDKSIFKSPPVEQPPANPALAKQTLNDSNTEGFTRLAAKVQGAATPAEKAKAMLDGLNTCLPHNRALVDAMKNHVNAIAKLIPQFQTQINPATLTAQNAPKAKAMLDQIKAEWQSLLAALPTQATPFVKVCLALIQTLEQQLANAKPARPATAAPAAKPQ